MSTAACVENQSTCVADAVEPDLRPTSPFYGHLEGLDKQAFMRAPCGDSLFFVYCFSTAKRSTIYYCGIVDSAPRISLQQAHLAQLVGADEAEHNVVDAHAFLEGLCAECLEEHETTKAVTLEDIAHTEEEALNLVSWKRLSCAGRW